MLRWTDILQHQGLLEQVCRRYPFPIEVRQYLHEWLEEQQWHQLNPDNPGDEHRANDLLQITLSKLRSKVLELHGTEFGPQRTRLEQAACTFQREFQHNPLEFLRMMKQCFIEEAYMLQSLMTQDHVGVTMKPGQMNREQQITEILQKLEAVKQRMEPLMERIQGPGELNAYCQQRHIMTGPLTHLKTSPLQNRREGEVPMEEEGGEEIGEVCLDALINCQQQLTKELEELYREAVPLLEHTLKLVMEEEMSLWKRSQQLACNGAPLTEDVLLDKLHEWCECLAELLVLMYRQIQRINPPDLGPPQDLMAVGESGASGGGIAGFLGQFREVVKHLLVSLVSRSLIVERQPEQVVQKDIHFSTTVQLLGSSQLHLSSPMPCVRVSVLNEEEARQCSNDPGHLPCHSSIYTLKDSEVVMEYPKDLPPSPSFPSRSSASPVGPLSAHFRMMLGFDGSRNRSQERVSKIKSCFRFQTSVCVEGIHIDLQAVSLPVVITVHGNQKCQAVATILWDNAFSLPRRQLFEVPSTVPWPKLAQQLQVKCKKMTGRKMSPNQLQFLADKIMGGKVQDPSCAEVSMAQLCERPLQFHSCMLGEKKKNKRRCTFWDWFYDTLCMIEKSLKELWEDGYIEGFLSKTRAEEILKGQKKDTFLFRFSDSVCGALSIAFVLENENGALEVKHTAPVDLDSVSLADTIRGRNKLEVLFPGHPKDEVFSKYYTPKQMPDPKSKYIDISEATRPTENNRPKDAEQMVIKTDLSSRFPQIPGDLQDLNMEDVDDLYKNYVLQTNNESAPHFTNSQ